jgi:hypothetical protein
MMKKTVSIIIGLVLGISLLGCGSADTQGRSGDKTGTVEDVIAQKISEEDNTEAYENNEADEEAVAEASEGESEDAVEEPEAVEEPVAMEESEALGEPETAENGVDVDLTALSSTMVYSEVYNMMMSPMDYVGKTIKMQGQFIPFYDEATDTHYFACIISDATACCSQGIEFILTEDYSYPEDYPSEGDIISVIGTFDTYMEGENMYCTLRDADLVS